MFVINFYHSDKDFNQQGKNLYVILSQSVSFIIVKKQLHPVKSQTKKQIRLRGNVTPPPSVSWRISGKYFRHCKVFFAFRKIETNGLKYKTTLKVN